MRILYHGGRETHNVMERLLKFLAKEKALLKFVRNYNKKGRRISFRELKKVDQNSLENIILNAFWWKDTPEGWSYWSELNGQYRRFKL